MTPRPTALAVDPDGIPAGLIDRDQWVCWRYAWRNGKWTKPPVNPHTGGAASSTDPATWGAFAEAYDHYVRKKCDGVGFVFSPDDDLTGIDMDACYDPESGTLAAWAQPWVDAIDTFWEFSPSGRGVHGMARGTLPEQGRKTEPPHVIEMYCGGRYFTITGHALNGATAIAAQQGQIDAMFAAVFPPKPDRAPATPTSPVSLDDAELIRRAMAAKNGAAFTALWRGDTSAHRSDHSRADNALCRHLMFWTRNDMARTDQLFRQSGLVRDKWRDREDYRRNTLLNSWSDEVYSGDNDPPPVLTLLPPMRHGAPPTETFRNTETGNARRLVDRYGDDLRYCTEMGVWLVWDGSRWKEDADRALERLVHTVVEEMFAEAENRQTAKAKREALKKWALSSESRRVLRNSIENAVAMPGVAIGVDDLDRDGHLLNVRNGTIDLKTGLLLPPDRSDRITRMVNALYDPDAPCPRWQAFLLLILPDTELRAFVQRAVGASLTGESGDRALLIPWGESGGGKTTFLETLHLLLGEYADSVESKIFLAQRDGGSNEYVVAGLRGKRMIYSVEPEADARLAEAFIKKATGGDRQNGRHPYGRPFSFTPTHTLWLAANHRPVIRGTDSAIWNRVRLIPFDHPIPEAAQKPKHEVLAGFHGELPGILAWAVQGAKDWYAHGLGDAAAVTRATASYREEMDTLGAWIEDCCVLGPTCWAYTSNLRSSYEQWCAENGARPLSDTQLGRHLTDRKCPPEKRNGRRTRERIALREDATQAGE
jgi:putative DNA primase/helicase